MYYPQTENKLMRQVLSLFGKIDSNKIVCGLLFLFPIGVVAVQHWASGFFGLLMLMSLILLFRKADQQTALLKEEKLLLWGFVFFFAVFIVTSLVNGWGPLQTRHAGDELRFLMFVPIYLMVRRVDYAAKYIIIGCVVGVIYTGYDAFEEIYVNSRPTYRGAYSQLLAGPVIALFIGLLASYCYKRASKLWSKLLLLLLVCTAFFVIANTGARSAYLASIVISIIFVFHHYIGVKKYIVLVVACIAALIAYNANQTIHTRVNSAFADVVEYFSYSEPAKYKGILSSGGVRLEMWRATPIFFSDNPLFGIGRGNYNGEVKKYIAQGLIHRDIAKHGHPHNVFSEVLISKGMLGLLSLFCITLYPLVVLIKDYRHHHKSAIYGILLISSFLVFYLTEASPVIKGNFVAVYTIFLAVLFSYHVQQKLKHKSTLG